ncbi:MAG: endolytic transglycosylase MltG [Propionibacteriaceae bacterium]|jgi:UPF0755 protein|nr:endolytic transglycosylase MltG [Propionibacteriaceae bacterium]
MRSGDPTPNQRVKSGIAVLVSLVILIGGVGFVGFKAYSWYQDWNQREDYAGDGDETVMVTIPNGATWQRSADILEARGVIASAETFMDEFDDLQSNSTAQLVLQHGHYEMKTRWPSRTALDYLLDPANRVTIKVILKEGWRWQDEIKPELVASSELTVEDFDAAAANPVAIGLPDWANGNLEGFIFPDTYELSEDATEILRSTVVNFENKAEQLDLVNGAAALGLTPRDIVIVASLIEKEVSRDADRPKVARAIYNRLAIDMPLGVESAFRYGRLQATGTPYDDPITIDSQRDASLPYNIYTNPGLPATPIGSPGEAALSAALHPAQGDWIYWTTTDLYTGETGFASNEEDFNVLVAQFREWCADNGQPPGCS